MMIRLFEKMQRGWSVGLSAIALIAGARTASGQCDFYTVSTGPATYIAATDDIHLNDDEATKSVGLPFDVSVFGTSYSAVTVSTNGFLEFGGSAQDWFNLGLPSASFTVPTIFAHWDDLYTTDPGDGVFTATLGTPGSQIFVIEWIATPYEDSGPLDFEVIFYENQPYFDIIHHLTNSGFTATVGIQESDAGPQTQFSANSPKLSDGLSLRFSCNALADSGACCDTEGKTCILATQATCPAPIFVLGGTCAATPCAPPANDQCTTAKNITSLPSPQFEDVTWATPDSIETLYATRTLPQGVWFQYSATTPGYLTIKDASNNPAVALVITPDCDSPATVGYSYQLLTALSLDGSWYTRNQVNYGMTYSGATADVVVGASNDAYEVSEPLNLMFDFVPYSVPPNDDCTTAFDLNTVSFPYTTSVDNYLATTETTGCSGLYHGVWYKYTPTWTGYLGCSENGLQGAAWAFGTGAGCPSLTCLSGEQHQLVPITAGQPMKLLVGSSSSSPDAPVPLELSFDLVPNDCSNALPIPVPGSVQGDLAYSSFVEPFWYAVSVPTAGVYTIQTSVLLPHGVNIDNNNVTVSVFSDCAGSPIDSGSGVYSSLSTPVVTLRPTLSPGTYLISVASDNGSPPFRLDISGPACPADFDSNHTVNVSDIFAFLRAWFAHDTRADIDANGSVNVSDIFAFLRHWFAHC